MIDRRINAFREDLADEALEGKVAAKKFVKPNLGQVIQPVVSLHKKPQKGSPIDTQILMGEQVKIFEETNEWHWVQSVKDDYVGYIPAAAITKDIKQVTHRVSVPRTLIYIRPDIKAPTLGWLSMNSTISAIDSHGDFILTSTGHYLHSKHITTLKSYTTDFVDIAKKFIETPYLWGGSSCMGIDCSGLVQTAFSAVGKNVPRDSDMQQEFLGTKISDEFNLDILKRGDLIFWKGHVGIMIDNNNIIHANGFHMKTMIEPISEAVKRIANLFGLIVAIKRLI